MSSKSPSKMKSPKGKAKASATPSTPSSGKKSFSNSRAAAAVAASPNKMKSPLKLKEGTKEEEAFVYHKEDALDLVNDPSKRQGIWAVPQSIAVSPTVVWVFEHGNEPIDIHHSQYHKYGVWGYNPDTDPSEYTPVDMWFYPPEHKVPKNFPTKGMWTYPYTKVETAHIAPDESGFVNLGERVKMKKLDVGGTWRMLYQKDGLPDEPIGSPGPKKMNIVVKTWDDTRIPLRMKPTDTIDDIKTKVEKKARIPKDNQRLVFQGRPLNDMLQSLDDAGIQDGDVIDLEGMKIYVKDPSGKKFLLDVSKDDTISDVKNKVLQKEGIPVEDQRLRFLGKKLKDGDTLQDSGVVHKSVLELEPMTIYVVDWKGTKYTLENVEPGYSIGTIKDMVEEQSGVPVAVQRLSFNGKQLSHPSKTLRLCGIKHKSILDLGGMEITVLTPDNKPIPLNVDPRDTILEVKEAVQAKEGIPVEDQRLVFKNKELSNKSTLSDNGIPHGSTLHLQPMEVKVRHWDGTTFPLVVKPHDTIAEVKKQIESEQSIPVEDQRLQYDGDKLKDPSTLKDCGIKHGAVLELEGMKIFVKDWDNEVFEFAVESQTSIREVKDMVVIAGGPPRDQQRLFYKQKRLDKDSSTLKDCKIKHKSTLELEPFEIKVKTPEGVLHIKTSPSETVQDVKKKVEALNGTPVCDQRLVYKGQELEDRPTLDEYNIPHGATVNLEGMEVQVVKPDGKEFTLAVSPRDTISDVKAKIATQEGIPRGDQNLLFDGKRLKDPKTLAECNVKHGDTLNLGMQVVVKDWMNRTTVLDVEPSFTISKIKNSIKSKLGVSVPVQVLSFKSKPLEIEGATLFESGIKHKSVLDLDRFHVYIKSWQDETFPLECEPSSNVLSIKEQIAGSKSIPVDNQYLIFGGNLLDDSDELSSRGIKHKSTLNLERMKIYVKTWKNKTFLLDVDPSDTILDVKEMIHAKEGMKPIDQVLRFEGVKLDDTPTLRESNVKYKSTLHLEPQPSEVKSPRIKSPKAVKQPIEEEDTDPVPTFKVQMDDWQNPFSYSPAKPKTKKEGTRAKKSTGTLFSFYTTAQNTDGLRTKDESSKKS